MKNTKADGPVQVSVRTAEASLRIEAGQRLLLYGAKGGAVCRDGQADHRLWQGDALSAAGPQTLRLFPGAGARILAVHFSPEALPQPEEKAFTALFPAEGCVRRHPAGEAGPLLSWLMEQLEREQRERGSAWQAAMAGQLLQALALLCRATADGEDADRGEGLARALAWIEAHYTEEIHLEKLAETAGISPRHFDRIFMEKLGKTPKACIVEKRMQRACFLLRHTDRPVTEIAFDCGYADSNYFARVFRKYAGCSPQKYRQGEK